MTETNLKVKETLKSVLLAALLVCTVVLAALTWVYEPSILPEGLRDAFSGVAGFFGADIYQSPPENAGSRAENYGNAVYPVRVSAIADGKRYLAEYADAQALAKRFDTLIGESLASSSAPVQINWPEWLSALKGDGVMIEYTSQAPLSLYALSHGVELPDYGDADTNTRAVFLSARRDTVYLFYTDAGSGGVFSSRTAVPSGDILDCLDGAEEREFYYAAENEYYELGMEPGGVINPAKTLVGGMSAEPVAIGMNTYEMFLEIFHMNPLSTYRNVTADGDETAVDDQRSVTFTADGVIIYNDNAEDRGKSLTIRDGFGDAMIIEELRRIAEKTEQMLGEATITLRSFAKTGDGYIATFGFAIGGIPVFTEDGVDPIYFEIKGNAITAARFLLRRYTKTEDGTALLPLKQAALIAGAEWETAGKGEGYRLGICYRDTAEGMIPARYAY